MNSTKHEGASPPRVHSRKKGMFMGVHWQLTPHLDNPEAAEGYDWLKTTTLVDHMRGGFFKVDQFIYFFEYVVGRTLGDPDTMTQLEVSEISRGLTRVYQESEGLRDEDEVDYPAPLEEFAVTYAQLRDLEATFRFAAEHHMVLRAY